MKKIIGFLLSVIMLVSLIPQQIAVAAQTPEFDQDFTQYLEEVSLQRGFEVTKTDIEASLAKYHYTLENFDTVQDMSQVLNVVIQADLSNLNIIYEEYTLNEDRLLSLLTDRGDDINNYIFLYDLDTAVYRYSDGGFNGNEDVFELELLDYLKTISMERGLQITKDDLEYTLSMYELTFSDFSTVAELKDYLGEVIQADLSNLERFEELYGLDQEAIKSLLAEYGETLDDYLFIDDLEAMLYYANSDFSGFDMEYLEEMMQTLFAEIDLTEEELEDLMEYFMSLEYHFADPETLSRFEAVGNRLMNLAEALSSSNFTKQQKQELISIYDELYSLLKIDVYYLLITGDKAKQVTLSDLIDIDSLGNSYLKIFIHDTNSKFLADLIIRDREDLESLGIYGNSFKENNSSVSNKATDNNQKEIIKTVKGAKLPKTSTNYISNALIGLMMAIAGVILFVKARKHEGKTNKSL